MVEVAERRKQQREAYARDPEKKRARSRAAYAADPDRKRKSALKQNYGLSLDDVERLLDEQGGGCAICGTDDWGRCEYPCVDHCHQTDRVRGLLCPPCNSALGFFKDDLDTLRKAVDYLEKSR